LNILGPHDNYILLIRSFIGRQLRSHCRRLTESRALSASNASSLHEPRPRQPIYSAVNWSLSTQFIDRCERFVSDTLCRTVEWLLTLQEEAKKRALE